MTRFRLSGGRRRRAALLPTAVTIAAVVMAACGSSSSGSPGAAASSTPGTAIADSKGATARNVRFTPATVDINRATVASSLTSISADGSTYTFSSTGGGVGSLKAGSVMLLEGTAVRRVASVRPSGGGVVVSTTPAALTDLVSDGQIAWTTPIDFSQGFIAQKDEPSDDTAQSQAPVQTPCATDSNGRALCTPGGTPCPTDSAGNVLCPNPGATPCPTDSNGADLCPAAGGTPCPTDASGAGQCPSPSATTGALRPGMPSAQEAVARLGAPHQAAAHLAGYSFSGGKVEGELAGYAWSLSYEPSGKDLVVDAELSKGSPLKLTIGAKGTFSQFTSSGAISMSGGHVSSASMSAGGATGKFTLSYDVTALTGLGAGGTEVLRIPASFRIPLIIGGLPFYIGIKTAMFIAIGFGQKNLSVSGSYDISYDGQTGLQFGSSGATSAQGAMDQVGTVVLSQANALLHGPVGLVIGAEMPRLDFGLGVYGVEAGAYIDLIGTTAIQVGGQGGVNAGLGPSTGGCDARALTIAGKGGVYAQLFGLSFTPASATLFSQEYDAAFPTGCGTVGGGAPAGAAGQ